MTEVSVETCFTDSKVLLLSLNSVFDRINSCYFHGLLFGVYRKRHISTRACVSREVFCEAVSFVDNNNKKNNKKPHCFNRICRFGSNKPRRVNPPRQSFDGCKFSFKKKKKTLVNAGHILPSNKRIFHNFTPSIRFKKPVHLNAFVAVY